jgi:hypothetical protein
VEAQIWVRVPKNVWSFEGPRTQRPPSFLNGRSLDPPRLFLELAKLSNQERRALVRVVTTNLMVTLTELQSSSVENLPE